MPGSIAAADTRTGIERRPIRHSAARGSEAGVDSRTRVAIPRQRRHQNKTTQIPPPSHTAKSIIGRSEAAGSAMLGAAAEIRSEENGWLISLKKAGTCDEAAGVFEWPK